MTFTEAVQVLVERGETAEEARSAVMDHLVNIGEATPETAEQTAVDDDDLSELWDCLYEARCTDRDDEDRSDFADPGGRSALRAGVRDLPCPTCKRPNQLTIADRSHGYQCDRCADQDERGGF